MDQEQLKQDKETSKTSSNLRPAPYNVLSEVSKAIVGKEQVLQSIFLGMLAKGHVLFEDYPGLAKTLTARSFASSLGCEFKRIQFTSDLLPSDITGSYVLNRNTSKFEFRRGPIFTNILLADEINRAPPRTQSALLEAMQENQVTIENETFRLESPFIVLATQNPIEYEGTYPLPEAQLDRFIMRVSMGYPSPNDEAEILEQRTKRRKDEVQLNKIASREEMMQMQEDVEKIHIDTDLERYIVAIVSRTREHSAVEIGSSPRGSLAILKLSKAHAWLHNRDYVIPDDIKMIATKALAHRIILTAEQWMRGTKTESVINDVISGVEVPKTIPSAN